MIRGAIFDVDGTLLDSMGIWENVGARYLDKLQVSYEQNLSEILYPMTIEEGAAYVKETYNLSQSISEIIEGVLDTVRDYYFYEAPLKEGVREFLEEMRARDIPMTAATSSVRQHIETAFERLEIDGLFEEIFTCSEVGEGKTSPLIYQKAAECIGAKPEEIYVFEDVLHALETAKKAGFQSVAVYDRYSEDAQQQLKEEADIYLYNMKQQDKFWEFVSKERA